MNNPSVYKRMTQAEREVADELKKLGIQWFYEHPVFVWDENKRPRVWAPDFYLVDFGIYVEVCGSEHFDYSYRKTIFQLNGYKVIFLHVYKSREYWIHHFHKYLRLFTGFMCLKMNSVSFEEQKKEIIIPRKIRNNCIY